jgi:predicted RNA-binding protein YlxR (DUF448 family)
VSERRHLVVRSCVGCGERDVQGRMVRLARDAAGALRVDPKRSLPGRGAYLHRAEECFSRFAKRRGMVRSLRSAVDTPTRAQVVAELRDKRYSE